MVNSFQQISSEQQQVQIEKCPLQDEKMCSNQQTGNNKWTRCIWRNLQKIVTLLVLVYLIVLIFNLLSCKESLLTISLPIKQEGKNSLNGQQLQQLQNSQISKQNILQEILNQNIGLPEKGNKNQLLTEIGSTQATTKSQHIKQNQMSLNSQQKNQKIISSNNLPKQISPSAGVSVIIGQKQVKKQDRSDFFNFVEDINKQIKDKQHQKVQSRFRNIYSQLSETPRSILRSLSFEKTKQIINKYAQAKDSMLLKLIAQNSQLNIQLSQNDIEYRKYLNPQNSINNHQEKPLCVIVNSHNNAHNSKIIRTLNSVYNQNYKNFKVVIVDQNSADKTSNIIKDYLSSNQRDIKTTSFISVDTDSQVFALWTAAKSCQEDTFAIYLDGNSQLLGKDVFNMINYQISNFKAHVVYGGQYTLDVAQQKISLFQPASYDESEQFMLAYRKIPKKYGRIVGFRTNALLNFPQSYMYFNEKPFEYSGIDSLAMTMLEMSCGNFKTIKEPLGLVLIDSKIQKEQKRSRQHELRRISQKLKMDIC